VNAALIRPGHQPGQGPSGGPLPHLIDVWRAAAPSLDFLAPDIYFQDFAEWARRYERSGNPLFVPEAMGSPEASVNALYALGAHDAIGFSPFGIETIGEPAGEHLAASYDLVAQLEPLLVDLQGKGESAGLLSAGPEQRQPQQVQQVIPLVAPRRGRVSSGPGGTSRRGSRNHARVARATAGCVRKIARNTPRRTP
jgi:hypothetical protein